MSAPGLAALRACFEGAVPAIMGTCAADGTPNVAYLSQTFYVDERHVALSFQFFNRTRANILVNPQATLLLTDPATVRFHRLYLRYRRTETAGPLFEGMRAQLAGIASHTGMAGVFKLLGADVYEVERIETLAGDTLPAPPARAPLSGALREASERLSRSTTLDALLEATLDATTRITGAQHALLLLREATTARLYTVASRGYARSGVGSEIAPGEGVIGTAAAEDTPVRIVHMTNAYLYSEAGRRSLQASTPGLALATDIPYPGLASPHSQLAVPLRALGRVLGVLFVESALDCAFDYEHEDALMVLAAQAGATLEHLRIEGEAAEPAPAAAPAAANTGGAALRVRHFGANDSVFLGEDYLIKGVAGAIFWKLLREHSKSGRTEFSNRELRLDASLGLPDVSDNLEARLLLLARRLAENSARIRIEKTGRGRFRLALGCTVHLEDVAG